MQNVFEIAFSMDFYINEQVCHNNVVGKLLVMHYKVMQGRPKTK